MRKRSKRERKKKEVGKSSMKKKTNFQRNDVEGEEIQNLFLSFWSRTSQAERQFFLKNGTNGIPVHAPQWSSSIMEKMPSAEPLWKQATHRLSWLGRLLTHLHCATNEVDWPYLLWGMKRKAEGGQWKGLWNQQSLSVMVSSSWSTLKLTQYNFLVINRDHWNTELVAIL